MAWQGLKLNLRVAQKQILTPGLVQMVSVLALNRLRSRFLFCGPMGRPMLERSVGDHPWRRAIARAVVDARRKQHICN